MVVWVSYVDWVEIIVVDGKVVGYLFIGFDFIVFDDVCIVLLWMGLLVWKKGLVIVVIDNVVGVLLGMEWLKNMGY